MGLAEQIDPCVALGDITHHPRHQLDPVQCGTVVAHGDLVFAALVAKIEQCLCQPALGHAAEVFDVQCFALKICHLGSPGNSSCLLGGRYCPIGIPSRDCLSQRCMTAPLLYRIDLAALSSSGACFQRIGMTVTSEDP